MKKLRIFAVYLLAIMLFTLFTSEAKTLDTNSENRGVSANHNVPDAVKMAPLTQEDIDESLKEKQIYKNNDNNNELSEKQTAIVNDPVLDNVIEKGKFYEKKKDDNDQKAISSLNNYNKLVGEQEQLSSNDERKLMDKMLIAIQSKKLDYSEAKSMILFMASRADQLDEIFQERLKKEIASFFESDPKLKHDIEVAYDPMFFGN